MKKLFLTLAVVLAVGGCGTAVPGGILIGQPTLEGRWVIADEDGMRFCITIQESRISILILECEASNGGQSTRITRAPRAAIAGPSVVLNATFNPFLFESTEFELVFTGDLQPDGAYNGVLRVASPDPDAQQIIVIEQFALLARP